MIFLTIAGGLFLIGLALYGFWLNLEGTKLKEWLRRR